MCLKSDQLGLFYLNSYSALYKFFQYMEKELKKTGVTRMIILQEYIAKHPDGFRHTQFNKRYNKWIKKVNPNSE